MALSADKVRSYRADVDPLFAEIPVKASTKIFMGEALSDDGGGGVADSLAVNESFLGFAEEQADNSSGAAGDINVKVRQQGVICDLAITGVTGVTDLGVAVYADDDSSFTLTSSGSNVQIGKIVKYRTTGYADVFFQGAIVRSV